LRASVWERIEVARERWNVLRHPFYRRWSAGELRLDELARYSGQYRHAVDAIATMSATVATAHPDRPELRRHAAEERDHMQLWDGFRAMAAEGTTIVVSSHVMDEAERCQRLGLLRRGKLLAEGTSAELRRMAGSEDLESAFLKLAEEVPAS